MGRFFSFVGRVLFSTLFIVSGVSKFTSYDSKTGGPIVEIMTPKMDCFLNSISDHFPNIPVQEIQGQYKHLSLIAAGLEVFGGLLFILDFTLGSCCLMLFLIGVTPVMHNFWQPESYGDEQVSEMINFMKNLSLFGGLLAYTAKSTGITKPKID